MTRTATLLAALALGISACGATATEPDATATDPAPETAETSTTTTEALATTTTTTVPETTGGTIALAESDLGTILVDSDGNTLYLFTPDSQGESVCYDECADAWPPLTGDIEAGEGVDASLLGTTPRTDGDDQVTYNGWPLYYFFQDAAPGDVNGQGANNVWYVLDAAGDGIGLPVTLALADSDLGTILVDGDGNTLYLFTPDSQGDGTCYDQCAEAWPPLTGNVVAGEGLDETLLGSAPRTDGDDQVTYNGWPLYYFFQDAAPGDVNGQGANNVWYVLDAAGDGIGLDG